MDTSFVLPSGAWVSSPLVLRVAGVPAESLRRLRFDTAHERAADLVLLARELAEEGDKLSAELHAVIGSLTDIGNKPAVVGLRRAIFQARQPKPSEWNDTVRALLPSVLRARIEKWIAALSRRQELLAGLPAVLAEETLAKQGELREAASLPRFRRALSHASPALFAELEKWVADANRLPRRQSMIRIAKYLARAAAKTSPYSTFTASGAGVWSTKDTSRPATITAALELNGFLTQRLSRLLCERPSLAPVVQIRANPSATRVGEKITFLGPPPREALVSVPATPAVIECLRLLGKDSRTLAELRSALGEGSADFLDTLLSAGLLERLNPVADQSADPLGDLLAWLDEHSDDKDLATAIADTREQLRSPAAVDDVNEHLRRHRDLLAAVDRLVERAGFPKEAIGGQEKNTVHENAVFTSLVAECATDRWRPALADLDVLRRCFAALDPALPLRIALGTYLTERFGSGARVPLLVLHHAIAVDLSTKDNAAANAIGTFLKGTLLTGTPLTESPLPRLRELGRIQESLRRLLLAEPDGDGVVRVDPDALTALAAGWPKWITAPASLACYLQAVPEGESFRIAVNTAHGGFGRGRSRVLHQIRQAGGDLPEFDLWRGEPGLAELSGTFAFSLNARTPSVDHEIDYPFTVSGRENAQRIPLGDIEVVHSAETGLCSLTSRATGEQIRPLHLGMMADTLLPPVARLLSMGFGATYYLHPSMPLLGDDTAVPDGIGFSPRIELGRVVVRRARWIVPAALVPLRAKGETDAEHLMRMTTWLRDNEIPTKCFVRMWSQDSAEGSGPTAKWIFDKSHKPVYVDFANHFLAQSFDRTVGGPGPVVLFEEALPDPDDAFGPDPAAPSVVEYLIEISEPGGRNA
ncbi:lantibiotic dehydratase family protein [Allokutzneria sp. A3M-2-11 16]|uniref:lantibiotic dehydratase n=1 Tax=Allokutzneria sp. A3M-2-11 16 TaxID=2962043 RepID=UPI0020B75059|nr:lantibiotic dehydratase [Allokutzneria sp. A3M-2-11 16]MCP3801378.1 lantibiotic dehydratase family protein [Allokutzneria sp. A3M-2-11 16]